MSVVVLTCGSLAALSFLGLSVYRYLAYGALRGESVSSWKAACLATTFLWWSVGIAVVAAMFRVFPYLAEVDKVVTYGFLTLFVGTAIYERSRKSWEPYWVAVHDSLEHATKDYPPARTVFNIEHRLLLDENPAKRKIALERILRLDEIRTDYLTSKP